MRTPAGRECEYFYGDYFRGRNNEVCRLLQSVSPPQAWNARLCEKCPVPGIQMANACRSMMLRPRLARPFPFIWQQVQVQTFCAKTQRSGFDPHIGCGACHELPPIGEQPDDPAV